MFVKNPEYFLAIVKERSISKAADRLYLSQPYLSQYLAKLEEARKRDHRRLGKELGLFTPCG